jgi:hypothetical protein
LPGGVLAGTETVKVELAEPPEVSVTFVGFRDTTRLEDAERLTVPVKPLRLVTVIVESAEDPRGIVRNVGVAMMLKSGPVTFTKT